MDGELVSDYPSSNGESEDSTHLRLSVKYTDKFNELFPFYLAIGMSYEQYWEMDSTLVKSYRTAYEIKQDIINQQLWLQGAYVYKAIERISPILHAFAKKSAKPLPYIEEPFSLTEKQREYKKEQKEKEVFDKGKMLMEKFTAQHNKKFEGEKDDGYHD